MPICVYRGVQSISYTMSFILYTGSLFEAMDTLHDLYFSFCCELTLETWAKGSSIKILLWFIITSATPTHYWIYNGQGSPTSKHFPWLKAAYSARNGRGVVSILVCVTRESNGLASADQSLSSRHVLSPPPIQPFSLAQNLSSKRIAPTDSMQKVANEYTRHQVNLRQGKWTLSSNFPPLHANSLTILNLLVNSGYT